MGAPPTPALHNLQKALLDYYATGTQKNSLGHRISTVMSSTTISNTDMAVHILSPILQLVSVSVGHFEQSGLTVLLPEREK